jgi:hypothetical protein
VVSLCSIGGGDGFGDLGHLNPSANNPLSGLVPDVVDVLVFPLGALPDLDFAATADNTHSHGGE